MIRLEIFDLNAELRRVRVYHADKLRIALGTVNIRLAYTEHIYIRSVYNKELHFLYPFLSFHLRLTRRGRGRKQQISEPVLSGLLRNSRRDLVNAPRAGDGNVGDRRVYGISFFKPACERRGIAGKRTVGSARKH